MPDDYLFGKWGRLLGALMASFTIYTAFDGAFEAGLLSASNDYHWRIRAVSMVWGAIVAAALPPVGMIAAIGGLFGGFGFSLFVGGVELTGSYLKNGISMPSFYSFKVSIFLMVPAASVIVAHMYLTGRSATPPNQSVFRRLASSPVLSLFFGACTVLGTAATIWPEFGPRVRALLSFWDRALLLIGFASALRPSELVALDVEHLRFENQGVVITIPFSKTDQHGHGQTVAVPYGDDPATCPVGTLKEWLLNAGLCTVAEDAGVPSETRMRHFCHTQPTT